MSGYAAIIRAAVPPLSERQVAVIGHWAHGQASHDSRAGTLRLDFQAEDTSLDAETVLKRALDGLHDAMRRHAGAEMTVLEARVLPFDEYEALLYQPAGPRDALAGVAETTELLGVTRQRLAEIRKLPAFPKPVRELKSGPVWDIAEIERFERGWDRSPGRPAKSA